MNGYDLTTSFIFLADFLDQKIRLSYLIIAVVFIL